MQTRIVGSTLPVPYVPPEAAAAAAAVEAAAGVLADRLIRRPFE